MGQLGNRGSPMSIDLIAGGGTSGAWSLCYRPENARNNRFNQATPFDPVTLCEACPGEGP
jgi:hypothetical protein